jgi:hypothetical protein
MRKVTSVFLLVAMLSLALAVPPTSTPALQGAAIVVTSTADSGPGSLRQALLDAQEGDTITFDPTVFPPGAPVTIFVASELPGINANNLTLDASNAGVILDGSYLSGDWQRGLQIVSSQSSVVRGLQIANFSGPAIDITGDSRHTAIGGDRSIGSGPFGQGNQFIHDAIGVNLATPGTMLNVIRGNLMGTDAAGVAQLGNERSGVWITEGANGNTIGPDNVIAYNGQAGIVVFGPTSVRNTITQNSLHDNAWPGINLGDWANEGLMFPGVFAYDLAAGTMTGGTCAHCTVEIFSDAAYEGAVFEGRVTADDRGVFTFSKGSAFAGPNLTTTATDTYGNTSLFSTPVSLSSWAATLQMANDLPKVQLPARTARQLPPDSKLGSPLYGSGFWGDIEHIMPYFRGIGVKRVDASMQEVEEPIDWSLPEFVVPPGFDTFVDALNEDGVAVNYLLHFWDKDGHARGEELETPRFKSEDQIQDFLDYVSFVVSHFKGRIQYYTIWTEPDACGGSYIKCIEPDDYINLARRVIPLIHKQDPAAKVSLGPVVLVFARDYLNTILSSDILSSFDVIQWHGVYNLVPDDEWYGDYYYEYPLVMADIKQTASANGFVGEYWGSDMSYGPAAPDQPWGTLTSGTLIIKYEARELMIHLGMDIGVGWGTGNYTGAPRFRTKQFLNTLMNGSQPAVIPVDVESEAEIIASYGFSLPNGDRLFALWTDGVAVEDDPGTAATLTFPGLSDTTVTGIDVLEGYEQELTASEESGNLVIRDLLVKDYPIILRLSSTKYVFLPIVLKGYAP